MSTTLTLSSASAMLDRGAVGLMMQLASGNDGQYVAHDLNAAQTKLYVRVLLHLESASGGRVVFATGFGSSGVETFRTTLDTDALSITLDLATGENLVGALASSLQWHHIEWMIDTVSGNAELWINGISAATATGTFTMLATQTNWLGGILKDTAVSGRIDLDEWVMADAPIGPVVVSASSDFADDPSRWLVIYNIADSDSIAWVQRYRDARGVPYANLLGLGLSTSETITATQFSALNDAIEQYLTDTGLDLQITGILIGYRVPGYVDFTGSGTLHAVGDLLHRAGGSIGTSTNFNAADALPTRPTLATLNGDRITARIDGADVAAADLLVTRTTTLINTDLSPGDDVTLYFDPFAGSSPLFDPIIARMVNWSQHIDRQCLRLPIQLSGPVNSTTSLQFSSISNDGFFWGWAANTPPIGFFATPAGQRILSAQFDLAVATATTLRSVTPSNWIDTPLNFGYAAAVASSKSYSASAFPYARPFFEALRLGWTLAEAWYLALPILREGLYLVGDPLLTVKLPNEGWDIFGPVDLLENLNADPPTSALRLTENTLALNPADGHYLVHRVDNKGRRETAPTTITVQNLAGVAAQPIIPPIWPRDPNWPVHIVDGQLELTLAWERTMNQTRTASIELRGMIDGDGEVILAQIPVTPLIKFIRFNQPIPNVSAQFRWQITSTDTAVWLSPWSTLIKPRPLSSVTLQTVEVSS